MAFIAATPTGPSLRFTEGCVTAITFGLAFCLPRLQNAWFARIETPFRWLARRKSLAVATVGLTELLLRIAILPWVPIPEPFVPDGFSFLLAANTFALGRLTNPTPAMWKHFESFHITMQPTYMSMYFPAQGLILAASKALLGHPWFGLLIVTALMCAAICWMLQAWVPSGWALMGGMLVVLHLGLFSYWINTYSGAGSLAALGGALVLGAFPRIMRCARFSSFLLLAIGIVILGLSRPYEGVLVCLPVTFVLLRWMLFGRNRPTAATLLRRTAIPAGIVISAVAWLGYYDYRVNGSPLTLPYTVNRAAYALAPYWIWQSPRPKPIYRHKIMEEFYTRSELSTVRKVQTPRGFVTFLLLKPILEAGFYVGFALLPPLIMVRRAILDKRTRFFVFAGVFWAAGMAIQIFLLPHYLAAFTAAFYAIELQCMRHLHVWMPSGKPTGALIVRFVVFACVVMVALRTFAEPLHLKLESWPGTGWNFDWYGPGYFGATRARVADALEKLPGKQLAIVRYSPTHCSADEWVYNAPDIDNAKVIWAREMDAASNLELTNYYKDRHVWLVQPDMVPTGVSPYTVSQLSTGDFINTRACPSGEDTEHSNSGSR